MVLSLSLFSCHQDDVGYTPDLQKNAVHSRQQVSMGELKNHLASKNLLQQSQLPSFDLQNTSRQPDAYILQIYDSKIFMHQKGNVTSFTMQIHTVETTQDVISNLVITIENDELTEIIIHYKPIEGWLEKYLAGEVKVFDGLIKFVKISTGGIIIGGNGDCVKIEVSSICSNNQMHFPGATGCFATHHYITMQLHTVPCDPEAPGNAGGGGGLNWDFGEYYPCCGDLDSGGGGGSGNGGGAPGENPTPQDGHPLGMSTEIIADAQPNWLALEQIFLEGIEDVDCLIDIYHELGDLATIENILKHFSDEASINDLVLRHEDLVEASTNMDEWGAIAYTIKLANSNVIEIVFNTSPLLDTSIYHFPKVILVFAMIHEMIHAHIYRDLYDRVGTAGFYFNYVQLDEFLRLNSPDLLNLHATYNFPPGEVQHELMAYSYRDTIIQALSEYDPSLTHQQKQALSWLGLNGTIAYQNAINDGIIDADELQEIYNDILLEEDYCQ
ncbi:MAG: hypothetical protein Q4F57_02670 [Weeksellaceae bacterium]|nr:hypothetical protein [Weeksellaceae bacterium]